MNVTRKVGAVLGAVAVLLAAPLDSGGIVGSGPCSTASRLWNLNGQDGHSFGGNFTPAWSIYDQGERKNSHYAAYLGELSSTQHPTCTSGGGDDDLPEVE